MRIWMMWTNVMFLEKVLPVIQLICLCNFSCDCLEKSKLIKYLVINLSMLVFQVKMCELRYNLSLL
jgi:hypothetical protein